MITSKDVKEEIKIARKVVDSDASTADKLKVLLKVVEVGIKVGLSTRVSLVKVMEHLKVPKVQPRERPKDNAEKSETKE